MHSNLSRLEYDLLMLVIIAIVFVCLRLQHSRIGRAWHAIREDEDVARAMGINVRNYKLLAFAMGASFGGVAGALLAPSVAMAQLDSMASARSSTARTRP